MMIVKIYHNPRCSKSRNTLQILRDHGIEPEIVEYLKTPPTARDLTKILALLEMNPRELMRKGEKLYKKNDLKDESLSDKQLITAMITDPILIERPIVLANGKAALGRPRETVIEIL